MKKAVENIGEIERRQPWHELEDHLEFMRQLYAPASFRVEFSSILPDDKGFMIGDVIHMPESQAYKFIFMNNEVSDKTVQFAINHAIKKVHRFIDNYKP